MDEMNLLASLNRVKAPPDFEQKVMARVSLLRRTQRERRMRLSFSLAGAFASLLVVFVLLNVFVLQNKTPQSVPGVQSALAPAVPGVTPAAEIRGAVPVIETLDYTSELRRRSPEAQTVYLLEQVSDTSPTGIKY
jgi:translation elongation factor EF-G